MYGSFIFSMHAWSLSGSVYGAETGWSKGERIMNYKALILESGIKMLGSGLTVETWGNISARNPLTGKVYLTPSGMDYSKISQSDVIVTDIDGNILEGERKPTIEMGLHLEIYKKRPEVNAIIHTHPIYSTVISCMGEDIPVFTDEAAQVLGDVCRTAEYALPGSDELAQNCIKALGDKANSCLLKSHGAVCVAGDMDMAFKVAKVLEMTAQILCIIKSCGRTPDPISDENIAAMQEAAKTYFYKTNK